MYAQSGGDLRLSAGCMPLGGPRPSWFSCRLQANHHLLVPPAAQEVPLGGSAESPDVAIGAILPPACLVGVDHPGCPGCAPISGPPPVGTVGPLGGRPGRWRRRSGATGGRSSVTTERCGRAASPLPAGPRPGRARLLPIAVSPAPPRPSPPWAPGVSHTLGKSWR